MTTKLPEYHPDIYCSKCDHIDISVQYCSGSINVCNLLLRPINEHLHRTCRRCGYGWVEKCGDAE